MAEMLTDLSLGVLHAILCWLPNKEGTLGHIPCPPLWTMARGAEGTLAVRDCSHQIEAGHSLPLSECNPTSGCGPDP